MTHPHDDVIERAAKAIFNEVDDCAALFLWEDMHPARRQHYRLMASVAIAQAVRYATAMSEFEKMRESLRTAMLERRAA